MPQKGLKMNQVTDATFAEETASGYVLVDFWAEWCGPCKMISPVLDELAVEMKDKLKIVKAEVDANQETATGFLVRAIPCLLLLKDGKEIARDIGARSKTDMKTWLETNIK